MINLILVYSFAAIPPQSICDFYPTSQVRMTQDEMMDAARLPKATLRKTYLNKIIGKRWEHCKMKIKIGK